jgi:hypothetical protein
MLLAVIARLSNSFQRHWLTVRPCYVDIGRWYRSTGITAFTDAATVGVYNQSQLGATAKCALALITRSYMPPQSASPHSMAW